VAPAATDLELFMYCMIKFGAVTGDRLNTTRGFRLAVAPAAVARIMALQANLFPLNEAVGARTAGGGPLVTAQTLDSQLFKMNPVRENNLGGFSGGTDRPGNK